MTHWQKDLGQEWVGANGSTVRFGKVRAHVVIYIHQLLQLLHCLQGEYLVSNLEGEKD